MINDDIELSPNPTHDVRTTRKSSWVGPNKLHIPGFGDFCGSSQALSGWMGTVSGRPFSGLSREVGMGSSLVGPLKNILAAVCFGSLSCWKVHLRPRVLLMIFIKDIAVLCSTQLFLNTDQSPSPSPHDVATTVLHCWDDIA